MSVFTSWYGRLSDVFMVDHIIIPHENMAMLMPTWPEPLANILGTTACSQDGLHPRGGGMAYVALAQKGHTGTSESVLLSKHRSTGPLKGGLRLESSCQAHAGALP